MTGIYTGFQNTKLFNIDNTQQEDQFFCHLLENNALLTDDNFCYYYQINKPIHFTQTFYDFLFAVDLMFFAFLCVFIFYGTTFYPYFERRQQELEQQFQRDADNESSKRVVPYTERYPIRHATQKYTTNAEPEGDTDTNTDQSPQKVLVTSFVAENTPEGFVIMNYDYDEEGFQYWSNKSISFRNLDTVARKFVTIYQMRDLYNGLVTPEENNESETEPETDTETATDTDTDTASENRTEEENTTPTPQTTPTTKNKDTEPNPFATFKSYNNSSRGRSGKGVDGSKIVNNQKKVNKFIHKGKLSELDIVQHENYKKTEPQATMTLASFKNMFYGGKA